MLHNTDFGGVMFLSTFFSHSLPIIIDLYKCRCFLNVSSLQSYHVSTVFILMAIPTNIETNVLALMEFQDILFNNLVSQINITGILKLHD